LSISFAGNIQQDGLLFNPVSQAILARFAMPSPSSSVSLCADSLPMADPVVLAIPQCPQPAVDSTGGCVSPMHKYSFLDETLTHRDEQHQRLQP
jgi:hypothetical protein